MPPKLTNLNLKQKYDVILMKAEGKKSVSEIAHLFNCGKTQIYDCLKDRDNLKEKYLSSSSNKKKMKKPRESSYEELNEILFEWFCVARAKNFAISGPILQTKALDIAKMLKLNDFKASTGWLRSFRKNRAITFNAISGEGNAVDENSVALWKTLLPDICHGYDLKDIANTDECALLYRVLILLSVF